jgi:hypothetical protein
VSRIPWFQNATLYNRNSLIIITSKTTLNCLITLSNLKQWKIYKVNEQTGKDEKEVLLANNPTLNYADLVIQPQTLQYGVYRTVFTVTMINSNISSIFKDQSDTFIRIVPSGLVLSTLKQSQPMYGGTIEITRGLHQPIEFDPYIFTYDIDSIAVISSLSFKYSCQLIVSNVPQGYPQIPGTNKRVYLDEIKQNSSLKSLDKCFNSISKNI